MGEMKVEHVLLFLVGAFLVYHMMKGCGCNKVEGMKDHLEGQVGYLTKNKPRLIGGDCASTTYGCCPHKFKREAKSGVDECLPHVVDFNGMSTPEARDACPRNPKSEGLPWSTPECYYDGQRCIFDPACLDPDSENFNQGLGCIVKDGDLLGQEDDHRTACRICGVEGYPTCPRGAKHPYPKKNKKKIKNNKFSIFK